MTTDQSKTETWKEPPAKTSAPNQPISIYQVHLDSWRRVPEQQNRPLRAEEIGPQLAQYVRFLQFTHVEPFSFDPAALETVTRCLREYDIEVVTTATPGFTQWDREWAARTLEYLGYDPFFRKLHQNLLTDRGHHPVGEVTLPLSHELVTPAHSSLLARMPGDDWQKFANLRLLLAWLYAVPGKKLLFMGGEFGQRSSWNSSTSLDWHLVREDNRHGRLQRWVSDLNRLYRSEPAFYQTDGRRDCFDWIDTSDAERSVISLQRWNVPTGRRFLAVFNFTPVPRQNYRVGVPVSGFWKEILNSDATGYGGSGQGNLGGVEAAPFGWQNQPRSVTLTLPPLGAVFLQNN